MYRERSGEFVCGYLGLKGFNNTLMLAKIWYTFRVHCSN